MLELEIRPLRPTDDRESFDSGNPDLDRFLKRYAGQNQFKHHIGTTYVAVTAEHRIVGYATVSPSEIEIEKLPATAKRHLPTYPVPVLRLARLAVSQQLAKQGLGFKLMRHVFELACHMATDFGCFGVVVDAKPGKQSYYRDKFGFIELEVLEGVSGDRPPPTPMFLSLKTIEVAATD